MFSNQDSHSFSDFYEGMQDLHSNYENNDNFGKVTNYGKPAKQSKGFKKITSAQSFSVGQAFGHPIKKSSSSNTFSGDDHDNLHFGKSVANFKYNDESVKESQSHFSSVTSLSSTNSMQTLSQKGGLSKHAGKKKAPTEMDFKKKYKTEVCKYWAEHGYCEFGDHCAFAHGETEIRQKSFVANNFKTKRCVSYHETGYCVYGIRCQFLHCYRKDCHFNPRLMFATYAEDLDNVDTWITENQDCVCLRRQNRPRLPIMEKVSNEHLGALVEQEGNQEEPEMSQVSQ